MDGDYFDHAVIDVFNSAPCHSTSEHSSDDSSDDMDMTKTDEAGDISQGDNRTSSDDSGHQESSDGKDPNSQYAYVPPGHDGRKVLVKREFVMC